MNKVKIDYDLHYKKWHDINNQNYVDWMVNHYQELLKERLPIDKQARILEIGCANGLALYALSKLGYTNTLGIDVAEEQLQNSVSLGVNTVCTDAEKFLINNHEKFDFIFMLDVLEHVEEIKIPELLSLINQSIKDEGSLFLQVPNAASPLGCYYRYIDWTHRTSFTYYSISHLLEAVGFKTITISPQPIAKKVEKNTLTSNESYQLSLKRYESLKMIEGFNFWINNILQGDDSERMYLSPNILVLAEKNTGGEFRIKENYNPSLDYDPFVIIKDILVIQKYYRKIINAVRFLSPFNLIEKVRARNEK